MSVLNAPHFHDEGSKPSGPLYRSRRSIVMDYISLKTVGDIVAANMSTEARLMTDSARYYKRVGKTFMAHRWVNHRADREGAAATQAEAGG
jgi:uncharacterized protein (UPF0218 family)